MNDEYIYYASAPKGVGDLLVAELSKLGACNVRHLGTGASFGGSLDDNNLRMSYYLEILDNALAATPAR